MLCNGKLSWKSKLLHGTIDANKETFKGVMNCIFKKKNIYNILWGTLIKFLHKQIEVIRYILSCSINFLGPLCRTGGAHSRQVLHIKVIEGHCYDIIFGQSLWFIDGVYSVCISLVAWFIKPWVAWCKKKWLPGWFKENVYMHVTKFKTERRKMHTLANITLIIK